MHTYIHIYIHTESEIVGIASLFAIQNCLGCYSKLNLGSIFHAKVATYLPHIKLKILSAIP